MKTTRTPLLGLIALGASLALAPAFAQETMPTAAQDGAAQTASTPPATDAAGGQQAPPPGAEPRQLTWADVDVDQSGAISKQESAQLPSLAEVFDQADADSDGELTPDEYRAFAAAAQPVPQGGG